MSDDRHLALSERDDEPDPATSGDGPVVADGDAAAAVVEEVPVVDTEVPLERTRTALETGPSDEADPSDEEEPPAGRVKPWEAFKIPNFRYLWGNSFSFAMIQATQRFAFVWLMLEVYGKAGEAGRITFVLGIPVLFFSLQAGALADRLSRKWLLIYTQVAAAVVSLMLTILLFLDALSYTLTIVLALLLGMTMAFGMPVRLSTIPTVVPKHVLMNAIVLNGFAQSISSFIGPALAGFLISQWDVKGAFAMSTALYVIGAICLLPMQLPDLVGSDGRRPVRRPGAIKEGFRFIAGHPGIRGLFIFLVIAAIFLIGPYGVLVPQVARVRLDRGAAEAGLMGAMLGGGTILSTIIQASLGDVRRKGRAFLVVVSCCGTMLAAVGLSTSYPLTLGLMFIWGIVGGFFMNLIQALIQSNTPHEYLGRVASVQTVAMQGVAPFGALIAGWGADTFQIMPWLVLSGVCMVGSAVIVSVTQPVFRRM